jgi:hypothetical protein
VQSLPLPLLPPPPSSPPSSVLAQAISVPNAIIISAARIPFLNLEVVISLLLMKYHLVEDSFPDSPPRGSSGAKTVLHRRAMVNGCNPSCLHQPHRRSRSSTSLATIDLDLRQSSCPLRGSVGIFSIAPILGHSAKRSLNASFPSEADQSCVLWAPCRRLGDRGCDMTHPV